MTNPDGANADARTGARALKAHPDDNVAVALRPLRPNETPVIADRSPAPPLRDHVPLGHKFALAAIPLGAPVVKFGQVIGHATAAIAPGAHVHLHNLVGVSAWADRRKEPR
jgi:altronate hydrolase